MAAFVSNWVSYLTSWGAVEQLNTSGLGLPDSKALKKRENEIKRLTKKFGPAYVAKMHSASDDFLTTLDHQIEAGDNFAQGFKKMMQEQGWFKTEQDRRTGKSFTQVLWNEKAAPYFDQLKKEADFVEKQAGVFGKQAKKKIAWVRSLSAFAFAWDAVSQISDDYRRALDDNLKGSMGFREAERDAWRALAGMETTRATLVATEFGEDYGSLRRVQSQFYQLFHREMKTRELRQVAALGRMMDLPAEDVAKYLFERKREFGIDAETSARELAEASVVYDDAVAAIHQASGKHVLTPMRTVFFQSLRQAQQSVHTMPQNMAVAARVMSEHLKQAAKSGVTTPEGLNKFVKQTAELAANDPHTQLAVGQELTRRLDATVMQLRRTAQLDPNKGPLDELGLRRQALEQHFGKDLVAQAQLVDRYYTDTKQHTAESLKEMAKLFLQTNEGQATQLEVMQKLYNPMSRQEVYTVAHSATQDPIYAAAVSGMIKSQGLIEMANNLRQQEKHRDEDAQRAEQRRDQIIDAVSTLPLRTYAWLKATWQHPWVKLFAALGLIGGGIWWDVKVRRRLGLELGLATKAILRLAAAMRRRQVAAGASNLPPSTRDTKRVGWLRTKLRSAWARIKARLTWVRKILARWHKSLSKLLRGALRLFRQLRGKLRGKLMTKAMKTAARIKRAKKGKPAVAPGRAGTVVEAGLLLLEAGVAVFDQRQTQQRMAEQQRTIDQERKDMVEQQVAEHRQVPTAPEDIYELGAYRRIAADAHHMDLLSHLDYTTTFDLGQQDYEDVERRKEAVEVWQQTDPGAQRRGITVAEASEYIQAHPPQLYISDIQGAVVHALRWIKLNQQRG